MVALIGTIASLAIGAGTAALMMPGAPQVAHIFIGAALAATSVGITARVLKDMGASAARKLESSLARLSSMTCSAWWSLDSSARGLVPVTVPRQSATRRSLR